MFGHLIFLLNQYFGLLDIDETVESGIDDLQRIQIDDVGMQDCDCLDEKPTENVSVETISADNTKQQESQIDHDTSHNSSSNDSNDTVCPQLSPSASPQENDGKKSTDKQLTAQESEKHIVDLITSSSWFDAVKAFKLHKQKWPEAFASEYENHIGSLGKEEDLYAMLNIYCKHLAQLRLLTTHPLVAAGGPSKVVDLSTCSIFVMTLTDHDMAKNVSRLMDASLQLLATVKLMETQLTKRKQSMSAQAVATVTERVYKQQEQVTQEIQQHHAHQQILQQRQEQQLLEEKQEFSKEDNQSPISDSWQGSNRNESQSPPTIQPKNIASEYAEEPDLVDLSNEDQLEHGNEKTETIQSSL